MLFLQVKHYHIQQADGYYWVNEKNKFRSVDEVCFFNNCGKKSENLEKMFFFSSILDLL